MNHVTPDRGQLLNRAGAAAVPPPRPDVPPPPPPPASGATPKAAPMTLAAIADLYGVPLNALLGAALHDVGTPLEAVAGSVDPLAGDAVAKVNAGARLTYALFHSGAATLHALPDAVLRAYRYACVAYEVRPVLPGGSDD